MKNQTQTKLQIGLKIEHVYIHPRIAFHDFWECVDEMNKNGDNVHGLYFGGQLGGFIFSKNDNLFS